MGHQNFFEYQPTMDLNRFLREYGQAYISNTTPTPPSGNTNVTFQTDSMGNLSGYVPSSGGGANPGLATQVSFYQTNGSVVSPTNLTSDGSALNVPGLLSSQQLSISATQLGRSNPLLGQPPLVGSELDTNVQGPGWSLGNNGGWSVFLNESAVSFIAQRGIAQNRSGVFHKHAVGDTAGIYSYVHADGGVTASSDEGVTAATFQSLENTTYFHGTVVSTSQIGGTPAFGFTSGSNWTTDGALLLNITKGTINGNLNGISIATAMDIGSGAASTYLHQLPVTGVTLPISTAIGIAIADIANQGVNAANPQPVTITVNLVKIGGLFKPFTSGSVVTVSGQNYPEQSILTAVTSPVSVGSNMQQTLSLKLRNPNIQPIIFQGGIQGTYISFDANLALSGFRSSYYAFGSLTGSDLIYGLQVGGGVANNILPQLGSEAAQFSGANSGFHLYPGAEVVANNNFGFDCTLEQNGVHWGNGDVVENPHYPVYGGSALFVVRNQITPTNPGFGSALISAQMEGPGTGGGNTAALRLTNSYNVTSNYSGSGGPLIAPVGIALNGPYFNCIDIQQAPDDGINGSIILVRNNNASASDFTNIITLDYHLGGGLQFQSSTGTWICKGRFDAQDGFLANHVAGVNGTFTTADSKTVTVSLGIITSIV